MVSLVLGLAFVAATALVSSAAAECPLDPETEAVLSLVPPNERAGATILSVVDGESATVRKGTNHQICELDTPGDEQFTASCYHAGLATYFRRSREIARSGLPLSEARAKLARELERGAWIIPVGAYQIYVSGVRPEPGSLPETVTVYHMVYLPMAESADVGLPDRHRDNLPWLHNAGTVDAHIMWEEERPLVP